MAIMLMDRRSPSRIVMGPRNSSVKFDGFHSSPLTWGRTTGASTRTWDAGIPLAKADVYTKGLKEEPAWRRA